MQKMLSLVVALSMVFSWAPLSVSANSAATDDTSSADTANMIAESLVNQTLSPEAAADSQKVVLDTAGIGADSFLFWLDRAGEVVHYIFTVNSDKKVVLLDKLQGERLAEVEALLKDNQTKPKALQRALNNFEANSKRLQTVVEKMKNKDAAVKEAVGYYFKEQQFWANNLLPSLVAPNRSAELISVTGALNGSYKNLAGALSGVSEANLSGQINKYLASETPASSSYRYFLAAASLENLIEAAHLNGDVKMEQSLDSLEKNILNNFAKEVSVVKSEDLSASFEQWLSLVKCDPASCLATVGNLKELKPAEFKDKVDYDVLQTIAADKLAQSINTLNNTEAADALAYLLINSDVDDSAELNELAAILISMYGSDELAQLLYDYGDDISGELIKYLVENPEITQALLNYEGTLTYNQVEAIFALYGVELTDAQEQAIQVLLQASDEINTEVVKEIVALTSESLSAEQKEYVTNLFIDYMDGGLDEATKQEVVDLMKGGMTEEQQAALSEYLKSVDQVVNTPEAVLNMLGLAGVELTPEQEEALTTLLGNVDEGMTGEDAGKLVGMLSDGSLSEEEIAYMKAQIESIDENTDPTDLVAYLSYFGIELTDEQEEALTVFLADVDEKLTADSVAGLVAVAEGGLSDEEKQEIITKLGAVDEEVTPAKIIEMIEIAGYDLSKEQEDELEDLLTKVDNGLTTAELESMMKILDDRKIDEAEQAQIDARLKTFDENTSLAEIVPFLDAFGVPMTKDQQEALTSLLTDVDDGLSAEELGSFVDKLQGGLTAEEKTQMKTELQKIDDTTSLEQIVPFLETFGVPLTPEQEDAMMTILGELDKGITPATISEPLRTLVITEQLTPAQEQQLSTFLITLDENVEAGDAVMAVLDYMGVPVPPSTSMMIKETANQFDEEVNAADLNYDKIGEAMQTYGLTVEEKQAIAATVDELQEDYSIENMKIMIEETAAIAADELAALNEIITTQTAAAAAAIENGDMTYSEWVGSNPSNMSTLNEMATNPALAPYAMTVQSGMTALSQNMVVSAASTDNAAAVNAMSAEYENLPPALQQLAPKMEQALATAEKTIAAHEQKIEAQIQAVVEAVSTNQEALQKAADAIDNISEKPIVEVITEIMPTEVLEKVEEAIDEKLDVLKAPVENIPTTNIPVPEDSSGSAQNTNGNEQAQEPVSSNKNLNSSGSGSSPVTNTNIPVPTVPNNNINSIPAPGAQPNSTGGSVPPVPSPSNSNTNKNTNLNVNVNKNVNGNINVNKNVNTNLNTSGSSGSGGGSSALNATVKGR